MNKMQEKTGLKPVDILRAPVEPPSVERQQDAPKPQPGQKMMLSIGFGIVSLGLIALPIFGIIGFLIIAAIGAILIAMGTMVRA